MTTYNITRRGFLRVLTFLSSFGLARPARALAELGESRAPNSLASKLAGFFSRKESAVLVGREYLRCAPREADVRLLVDLICSFQEERRAELASADMAKLRELLLLRQRQDFGEGRTVHVHGWILSETEARLCALADLI
jgi:hypothetical protein